MSSSETNVTVEDFHHYTEFLQMVWHSFCAPFAIIFNLLVFYIAFRHIRFRERLNQWFVVIMTLGDFGFTLIHMDTMAFRHSFPQYLCITYYVLSWSCQQISVLSLLALNVDKLLSLSYPLNYKACLTPKVVAVEISVGIMVTLPVSLASFLVNINGWLGVEFGQMTSGDCHIRLHPVNYVVMVAVYYILPSLVSAIVSFHIFYLAHVKMRKQMTVGKRNSIRHPVKGRGRRIFFVFSSTVWSLLTFLPYRVAVAVYILYIHYCNQDETGYCCYETQLGELTQLLLFLLPLGVVGNPLITLITQFQYRQHLKQMIWAQKIGLTGLLSGLEASYERREQPVLICKMRQAMQKNPMEEH